jgi:hypothetical protein
METDMRRVDPAAVSPARRKVAAGILCGSAGILTVLWVGQSLAYVFNGRLPQFVVDGGGGTHLVAAFDLTCIVPLMLLGGRWLLQQRAWGYLIAAAMLVQGTLIVIDLLVTPAFQAAAGIADAWMMVPVWMLMGGCFLTGAAALIRPAAQLDVTGRKHEVTLAREPAAGAPTRPQADSRKVAGGGDILGQPRLAGPIEMEEARARPTPRGVEGGLEWAPLRKPHAIGEPGPEPP